MCKASLARMNQVTLLFLATSALVFVGVGFLRSVEASLVRMGLPARPIQTALLQEFSETPEQRVSLENQNVCAEAPLLISKAERLRSEWKRPSIEEAIANYQNAQTCWHRISAFSEEAAAWKGIGDLHLLLSEFESARSAYANALALRVRLPDRAAEAEAAAELSLALSLMGQINDGMKHAETALRLSRAARDPGREAQALYALAIANYLDGKLAPALDYQTKALPLAQATKNKELLAKVLLGIGYVHNDMDDLETALGFYKQALSEWQAIGNRSGEAKTLSSIGLVYTLLGDRQKALEALRPTLALMQQIGDRISEGATLNNTGYLYQTLGDLETALQYYLQSKKVYESTGFLLGRILALGYCGDVYALLGKLDEALRSYEQAVILCRSSKNRLMEADALNGIAALYLSQGQRERAYRIFKDVLVKFKSTNAWRSQSATLNHIGYYFELSNQISRASDYYTQALSFAQAAQDKEGTAATLYNLARVELRSGDLKQARKHVEECLAINEASRAKLASHNLRGSYLASVHKHYEFYIDVLMRLHKAHPAEGFSALAMQASEKARSRSLLELLTEAGADIRQGVSFSLLERERSLQRALNAAAARRLQFSANKSPDESKSLSHEIKQLTRDLEEVDAEIKTKSPRYAALTRPEPLNLSDIQQTVLDDNSVLLEYALGDDRSYLWAITRTDVSSYELPSRAEIEQAARNVYQLLTANQPLPGETFEQRQARVITANGQFPSAIASLSKILLEPVAANLGTKRLLIVADGALQYIPFQILTKPDDPNLSGSGISAAVAAPRPLVADHEIVNEPSASALSLLIADTTGRKQPSNSVAVFADPVFEVDDPRIKSGSSAKPAVVPSELSETELHRALRDVGLTGNDARIPRLAASRDEADAIMAAAPWWSGFKAMGFDANRTAAMRSDLGNYRIVHFATHGFLNDEHPELSGVVLSLFDEKGQAQEGFLRLHDIYNLKLPVDLVVLSACNTGLGKDVRGEGLIGLTRGFMYAGASSVVASLWKVDDEATAELMRYFYGYMLQEGLSPAAALRKAQVTMSQQKRWQSPYYWAGFVIQGQYIQNERASRFAISRLSLWLLAGVILAGAAFYLLKRRRKIIL